MRVTARQEIGCDRGRDLTFWSFFLWNLGFLLGITIILQIITGIFLGLHYTSDLNSAYSSLFFFIREIFYVAWILIHYLLQL